MKIKPLYLVILSSILFGCGNNLSQTPQAVASAPIQIAVESNNNPKTLLQLPNFAALVKQVGNTVVNITAETTVQANAADIDPFFELFRQFGQQIPRPKPRPQIRTSMGSGFIISKDGYILTNSHVVDGAKKITVKTTDKRELTAKLIGQDAKTDIALLKVEVNDLPVVKIGDPDKLEVGEWVAAIGAPFGFDNSVTQGIVSAKGRNISGDTIVPFIQSDVPINPGNSGGPLFNLNGEVVGINSQIYSRSGGYMGISFSIPIDIAVNIANQLKQYGKASHGLLGVQVQAVTSDIAKSFGLKSVNGALIAEVLADSAAFKAGLKTGDIILSVDGKDISDSSQLPLIIGSKKPGETVSLGIFRNNHMLTVKAVLQGDNTNTVDAKGATKDAAGRILKLDKFGLSITNLDSQTQKQLNTHVGVMVSAAEGVAQMSGIQEGDVILSVNNKEVTTINEVQQMLKDRNVAAFLILRGNQRMYITISVG